MTSRAALHAGDCGRRRAAQRRGCAPTCGTDFDSTRELLRRLAEAEGVAVQAVLGKALELYRRQRFLGQVNAAYASTRRDDDATD